MKISAVVILRCDGQEKKIGLKECTDFCEERDTEEVTHPNSGGEKKIRLTGRGSVQLLHGIIMSEKETKAFLKGK